MSAGMPAEPTFSVVIAAYDADATIEAAIDSALAQTRSDFEVIVVDDGSTDATAQTVAARADDDPRIRLVRQANAGPAAARNAGIARARGRIVCTLDSDDLWLPRFLERMGDALDRAPEAGFAYTDAWAYEEASGRIRRATAMSRTQPPPAALPRERLLEELMRRNFVFNAVAIRAEVLAAVGGYDPELPQAEDYELWLRILAAGYGAVRVAGPLAVCRDRPASLSHDETSLLRGLRGAYVRVLERHRVPPGAEATARARIAEVDAMLAARRRGRPLARALLRGRRLLGATRRRLLSRRRLYREPPPEVAAAFPGLGRGPAGRDAKGAP